MDSNDAINMKKHPVLNLWWDLCERLASVLHRVGWWLEKADVDDIQCPNCHILIKGGKR